MGALPSERTGGSLLRTLGVTDTVVNSGTAYVEMASRIVRDVNWRRELSARMRMALATSPLTDIPGFVRDYEEMLPTLQESGVLRRQPENHVDNG
jgi:predicted O-linked N-acetylglucosamine transferase (SPINDLY family)